MEFITVILVKYIIFLCQKTYKFYQIVGGSGLSMISNDNVKRKSTQFEAGGIYAPYMLIFKDLSVPPEECLMYGRSIDNCDEPCCEYAPCKKFVN